MWFYFMNPVLGLREASCLVLQRADRDVLLTPESCQVWGEAEDGGGCRKNKKTTMTMAGGHGLISGSHVLGELCSLAQTKRRRGHLGCCILSPVILNLTVGRQLFLIHLLCASRAHEALESSP